MQAGCSAQRCHLPPQKGDGLWERNINRKGEALGCFSAGSQGRRPRGVEWHPVTVALAASPRPACHPWAKLRRAPAHPADAPGVQPGDEAGVRASLGLVWYQRHLLWMQRF